ncbi:hypothetical protein GS3922_00610 [Geobacillus subterraneus]|uniref:ATP-grasp domain-containing protein n=2 Tax=Geobacillus TaxID=129337 RepID=A0ABM6A7U6_9BACL|nr:MULTISPECIES: ATP-grasp domain-containing protein [Geobacillus]AMX82313.1 hypothetical protein GS3922_00610 [Geobacillus subterraneus]KZS25933.1 hypothetical protein A5418_07190 [Geobacillus subterraneus]OXB91352.1 hypothetical protein B9L21_00435 [Geobacillus uzenensis]
MSRKNVLVFPGATEIGLEIWRALKDCKDIMLFSAGSEIPNHAPYVYYNHFIVPDVNSNSDWISTLNKIILEHQVDYIYPAHDDVIVALALNKDKIKTKIISSPLETCLICRSKTKTYKRFAKLLPVPKMYKNIDEIENYPVFVKPDKGQGAKDAQKVNDKKSLQLLLEKIPDLVVLEYLSGKEYTVDCFTDREKGLLFCSGRERVRTKSGISMNSKPVSEELNKKFREYANIICKELDIYGAWFFQLKLDSMGVFKLLEIAPRISGTMCTHRVLGINFPLLSIYEEERVDLKILKNEYQVEVDRALVNRYKHNINFNKVYVDLDDTIIINDKLNIQLISFLFQCLNNGCKIILITKTNSNLNDVLSKWRIADIFDEVIWIKKDQSKADFINPEDAIFIDDSFAERKSVFDRHKIPTFDCNMIELLTDERV